MTALAPPDPADLLAGTTPHPAATPQQQALLDWADAHPIDRATIAKDGNGRYKVAAPGADKPKGHTRVTAFASALDDTEGLTVWRHRLLTRGLTSSDELVAAVRHADDNNQQLSRHIAAALHIAGEKLAADIGTAMHHAMEHAILHTGHTPPAPYDADVAAALAAMKAADLRPAVEHLERIAYIPDYQLVGTMDLLVAGPWGDELRILDYKTGSGHERISYAVQLACYAAASHLWKPDGTGWEEAPRIANDVAYILHMPAATGTASVVEVDIARGANLAAVAADVRHLRSAPNVRALFSIASEAPAPTGEAPGTAEVASAATSAEHSTDRSTWLLDRIRTITDPTARTHLAKNWPDTMPTAPPWTDAQIDAISPYVLALEPTFIANPDPATPDPEPAPPEPTPAPSLWTVTDDGTKPTPDAEAAVVAAFEQLEIAQRNHLAIWVKDGRTAGRPWALSRPARTARTVAIQHAASLAVAAFWDDDDPDLLTRLVLTHILGEIQPGWRTGSVLGALDFDQATYLANLAADFQASAPHAVALCGALVAAHTAA